VIEKNIIPSLINLLEPTPPMYHISVQEFKEHVRLSHSWSELVRRCGQPTNFGRFCSQACLGTLRQKVLFLNLDTQHFTQQNSWMKTLISEISEKEFIEFVCLSQSWSDLARRCAGERAYKKSGRIREKLVTVLKKRVLFLKLDTQHFTRKPRVKNACGKRELMTEGEGEVVKCRLSDVSVTEL